MADFNKSQGTWGRDANVSGTAKAWLCLDGTGTIAIRDSYNVSGVTDNGTSDYTINWDTYFSNDDFAAAGMCDMYGWSPKVVEVSRSTGHIRVMCGPYSGSFIDVDTLSVIAVGN